MRCPVCRLDQVIVEWEGIEIDMCLDGHGVWFDSQELRILLGKAGIPQADLEISDSFSRVVQSHDHQKRRCPRCRRKMETVQTECRDGIVHLDRCPEQHGIWFDRGELEAWSSHRFPEHEEALSKIRSFLAGFHQVPSDP